MNAGTWIGLLAAAGVLAAIATIYNRLVRLRNQALAAWSDVAVQLERRHDVLPKLVEAVRRYAAYEQSVVDAVTALRAVPQGRLGPEEMGPAQRRVGRAMRRLLVVAEAYPELRAQEGFLRLQQEISAVENDLQHARRFYNGAVRMFNTRIQLFPDLLVARLFRFRPMVYFQYDDDEEG